MIPTMTVLILALAQICGVLILREHTKALDRIERLLKHEENDGTTNCAN